MIALILDAPPSTDWKLILSIAGISVTSLLGFLFYCYRQIVNKYRAARTHTDKMLFPKIKGFIPVTLTPWQDDDHGFQKIPVYSYKDLIKGIDNENNLPSILLIIGSTGAGKSAIISKLHHQSCNTFRFYWDAIFGLEPASIIKVFSLFSGDAVKNIVEYNKVKEKCDKTILLLDGLDEMAIDGQVVPTSFIERFNYIRSITGNFFRVVITCRSQYISSDELKLVNDNFFEVDNKNNTTKKATGVLEIAPFSNEQIKEYINSNISYTMFLEREWARLVTAKDSVVGEKIGVPFILKHLKTIVNTPDFSKYYNNISWIIGSVVNEWISNEIKRSGIRGKERGVEFDRDLRERARYIAYLMVESNKTLLDTTAVEIANAHIGIYSLLKKILGKDNTDQWMFTQRVFRDYFAATYACFHWEKGLKYVAMEREFFYAPLAEEFLQKLIAEKVFTAIPSTGVDMLIERGDCEKSVSKIFVAKTPVTVKQYKEFMEDTGHIHKSLHSYCFNWHAEETLLVDSNEPFNIVEEYDIDYTWGPFLDLGPVRSGKEEDNHPVVNVSLIEMIFYCNWLSRKCNLEECYQIESNIATFDITKNGYRLIIREECSYLLDLYLDQDEQFYSDPVKFAWCLNSFGYDFQGDLYFPDREKTKELNCNTMPVRQLSCEYSFIYDLFGNVYELIWAFTSNGEKFLEDIAIIDLMDEEFEFVKVGGSFLIPKQMLHIPTCTNTSAGASTTGFRVVRTHSQ